MKIILRGVCLARCGGNHNADVLILHSIFMRFKQLMIAHLEMVLVSHQKYSGAPVGNGMTD